jgi:phosphoribosylglycinamide formyltransferase 1
MNIVVITSNSIRHNYFKIMFSNNTKINVIKTYVESEELLNLDIIRDSDLDNLNEIHFHTRHNIEHDFFSDIINNVPDKSNSKYIDKGDINSESIVNEIYNLKPDLIITYGCSIIRPKLINLFHNKILNVHLGLSPYYFGAGTNFHALVNNEIHFFGYTFMYIDEGIDTGEIIHQARPDVFPFDNPHQIGNRLIKKMVNDFIKLVVNFKSIKKIKLSNKYIGKTYKRKDATIELTEKLYNNFKNNSIFKYLKSKDELENKYKLVQQDFLK